MKDKRVVLRVSLVLPEDVSRREIREYVKDAIQSTCGCFPPESGVFHLDRKTVKVSLVAAGRKFI